MRTCLVVTGAAGELGRSLVRAALAYPAVERVIATTRTRGLDSASARLLPLEGLDLTTNAGSARLSDAVASVPCSRIGLVHCAGAFPAPAPLHRTNLSEVADTFSANVLTFLGAARALVPSMRRHRQGSLLAFTSHTQEAAYPFLGPFNLSKAGLLSAVQTLANENARFGISVNAIAVATLQTETERRIKPTGPFDDWVPVDSLADVALEMAVAERSSVSGNQIHFWKYSPSFFGQSVFARNSLDADLLDPDHD